MDTPTAPPAAPALVGQQLTARPRLPWLALSLLCAGMALAAGWGLYGTVEFGLFGLLAVLLGLAAWLTQPRRFAATLTADSLELAGEGRSIPYRSLDGLKAWRRPLELDRVTDREFAIQVYHRDGIVTIPARLNVSSDQVFHFLLQQLVRGGGDRSPPPLLADHLERQQARHGAARVLVFRSRRFLTKEGGSTRRCALSVAAGLAGLLWFWLGLQFPAPRMEVWGVLGLILGPCAFAFAGLFAIYIPAKRMPDRWAAACLIVGPDGLALSQGKIQGELHWDEVRKVEVSAKQLSAEDRAETFRGGIRVRVDGASIIIGDIYDRPVQVIYQAIRAHWRERS